MRERWKARTYTPFSLFPHLAIIVLAVYLILGINVLGRHDVVPIEGGVSIRLDPPQMLFVTVFVPLTFLAGAAIAFLRRRTRRSRTVGWGWTWTWRWLRRYDDRFHLFPFGRLKKLSLTEAAYGDFNGAACASFSLWPRWQLLRRFYDVDLVELPAVLPGLALFPEHRYDRAAAALGGADVVTESEAFNREWRVVADDERYALAILHPLMIEELLKPAYRDLALTIDGGAILTWHPGRTRFKELGARLALLRNLATRIPRHVWEDFGEPRVEAWGSPGTLFRDGWDSVPVNPVDAYKTLRRTNDGRGFRGVSVGFGTASGDGVAPPASTVSAEPEHVAAAPEVDTSQTFYPEENRPLP